jgi:hypothetical protein
MTNSTDVRKEILSNIEHELSSAEIKQHMAIQQTLSLLFFKNYGGAYITTSEIDLLVDCAKNYEIKGRHGCEYTTINYDKFLPIINQIREKIKLPKLLIKNKMFVQDCDE